MKRQLAALVLLLAIPAVTIAADTPVTRRDGFLMIWESIKRPITDTRETRYADVPAGSIGEKEITYARHRGFLDDDTETFAPDAILRLPDALLWMMRTRNVDDLKVLTPDAIPGLALKYNLITRDEGKAGGIPNRTLTEHELADLIQKFDAALKTEVHEASLYGEYFQGKGTAFGESFNMYDLTAAHRTYPYNTLVRVTNIANNKSVTVRINDRGPYVKGRDMDLSVAAFTTIEDRSKGKLLATFVRLGDVTLVGACARRDTVQKRIAPGTVFLQGVPQTLALGATLTLSSQNPFVILTEEYPGGEQSFVQNWILKGEKFTFTPSEKGIYKFLVGTREGKQKWFRMEVAECE